MSKKRILLLPIVLFYHGVFKRSGSGANSSVFVTELKFPAKIIYAPQQEFSGFRTGTHRSNAAIRL